MTPFLMNIPAALEAAVTAGSAYVDGALVKSALTNQVLGHLQPTLGWALPAIGMVNPVAGMAITGFAVATSVAGLAIDIRNGEALAGLSDEVRKSAVEIARLRTVVESVQSVATIGAAASVIGIGVSIGGFALTMKALERMGSKLDVALGGIENIKATQRAQLSARLRTPLERAEGAFDLPHSEARRYWQEADGALHGVANELVGLMTERCRLDLTSDVAPPPHDVAVAMVRPESRVLLQYLAQVICARNEALFCLQLPVEAARWQQQASRWLDRLPADPAIIAHAMGSTRLLPPQQLTRIAVDAKALSAWTGSAQRASDEGRIVAQALHQGGGDSLEYVKHVRGDPAPRLLFMPHGPDGTAFVA